MTIKTKNERPIEDIAFDCVYDLYTRGLGFEEADFYSLSDEDAFEITRLLHMQSDSIEKHEALSSGDSFDCYGELLVHNPQELVQKMCDDLIQYYKEQIDYKIELAIHMVRGYLDAEFENYSRPRRVHYTYPMHASQVAL